MKNPPAVEQQIKEYEEEYSCCNGKLYAVPEKKRAILTFLLIQTAIVLHEIFHLSWYSTQHYFAWIAVLILCQFGNFYAMVMISTTQPGIIQKISEKYETESDFLIIPKNDHIRSHITISYVIPQALKVNRIKFCPTCNIYRPPRSSHCDVCGVCIERMDHHCPWLGTCIGKRNYKQFYVFLLSLMLLIIILMAMCINIMNSNLINGSYDLNATLRNYPLTIILTILSVPALLFVSIMLVFHTYLLFTNLTTKQFFDKKWQIISGNLYQKNNCFKNALKIFFTVNRRQIKYKYTPHQHPDNEASSSSDPKAPSANKSKSSQEQRKRKQQEEVLQVSTLPIKQQQKPVDNNHKSDSKIHKMESSTHKIESNAHKMENFENLGVELKSQIIEQKSINQN